MRTLIRLLSAALLGVAAAILVSCGSSGSGLIPTANAGPLQSDFNAVAQAAAAGNGSCARTESALGKTEQDFLALPATIDRGLRARLQQGIANLHNQALAVCIQPASTATSTTSTETTPTTTTTTTTTETTPSTTTTTPTSTQTTPTNTTPPSQSGGTEASGENSGERGAGAGQEGAGNNGGSNPGGASAGGGK